VMGCYFTKPQLYRAISTIKQEFHLDSREFQEDFLSAYNNIPGLQVAAVPFSTPGLRGMAHMGCTEDEDDIILLNSNRGLREQKFSCAHEFIHLIFHRDEKRPSFKCYDKIQPNQNSFYEWHANEGAAELFVPYKKFIPRYIEVSRSNAREFLEGDTVAILADEFQVTEGVISNRINSLNYEIWSYLNGTSLDEIKLYSNHQLEKRNWHENHIKWYCKNCLSVVSEGNDYCTICGHVLKSGNGTLSQYKYKNRGAGYMLYSGIDVDEKSKAKVCPVCGNEEVSYGDKCIICGANLINICNNTLYSDYGNPVGTCDTLLPGNARYCPHCGGKSSYYVDGYLKDWKIEQREVSAAVISVSPKLSHPIQAKRVSTSDCEEDNLPF